MAEDDKSSVSDRQIQAAALAPGALGATLSDYIACVQACRDLGLEGDALVECIKGCATVESGLQALPQDRLLVPLESGTSAVRLEGRIGGGLLSMYAQQYDLGADRTTIVHAEYDSTRIYRGLFSYGDDSIVTLVARDDDAQILVTLSDGVDEHSGYVTVAHDNDEPRTFAIDVRRFIDTRDLEKCVVGGRAADLDLVGRRRPPEITATQIYQTFEDDEDYQLFMRGVRPEIAAAVTRSVKEGGVNWKCAWICLIPACGLTCLLWKPNKEKKKKKFVNAIGV